VQRAYPLSEVRSSREVPLSIRVYRSISDCPVVSGLYIVRRQRLIASQQSH
jgi:hypothetical protein